jgi:hypothetical protein
MKAPRLYWRIWFLIGDFIQLAATLVSIATFTFYHPTWWTTYFNWYIDNDVRLDWWPRRKSKR